MNYNPDFQAAGKLEEIFTCFHVKSDIVCLVLLLLLWPCDVFTECISYSSCRMSVILIIKAIFGNLMLSMRNIQNEVGELCCFFLLLLLSLSSSFRQFVYIFWPIFRFLYSFFSRNRRHWSQRHKSERGWHRERESEKKQNTDIFSYSIIWASEHGVLVPLAPSVC